MKLKLRYETAGYKGTLGYLVIFGFFALGCTSRNFKSAAKGSADSTVPALSGVCGQSIKLAEYITPVSKQCY